MKKNSIFVQILTPVLIILFLYGFIVVGAINIILRSSYSKKIKKEMQEISSSLALNTSSYIKEIYYVGEELVENKDIQSMYGFEQEKVLKAAAQRYPQVELFYVQNTDGDQTARSTGKCSNRKNRWWFIQEEQTHKSFVSKSYYSASTGSPCVSIFYPMMKGFDMYGIFGIDMSLAALQNMIEEFSSSDDGRYSFIIDGEGAVTAHPNTEYVNQLYNYKTYTKQATRMDSRGNPVLDEKGNPVIEEQSIEVDQSYKRLVDKMLNGETGYGEALVDGKKCFLSYCPVSFEGDSDSWTIVTIQSERKAFSVVYRVLFISIAIGFVIVVVSGFVVGLLSKRIVNQFQSNISGRLENEIQNLVVSTKETASVTQDQNAAVKEIVATMEDNNELSNNISVKIKDVTGLTQKTSTDVSEGVQALEANIHLFEEIFNANKTTITGIKDLGDKIGNIWEIVTLINSVADQAKIIAFNAELEASSAGEAGKNFHIVATEIRRLSDGIIDGTKEIKERITEIQKSSDGLLLASENGTKMINDGFTSVNNLEQKFDSIKTSSEITYTASNDITQIIKQQALASEQILLTLKQIASGVESGSNSAEKISGAALNLKTIAQELSSEVKE